MNAAGQLSGHEANVQQSSYYGRSTSVQAAEFVLPPIADIEYGFRFSGDGCRGGIPQLGPNGAQAGTPIFGAELQSSLDGGMGATGLRMPDRSPARDGGLQWGFVGMNSPSKVQNKGAANDVLSNDEVFRLLGSIGRLSPLPHGAQGDLGYMGPLLMLPGGKMGDAKTTHPPRSQPDSHQSKHSRSLLVYLITMVQHPARELI